MTPESAAVPGEVHSDAVPRVKVIALGGTIASLPTQPGESAVPQLTAEKLVSGIPQLAEAAEITAETFTTKPSGDLTYPDIVAVAAQIADDCVTFDGFVVTQGTDTLEETAYLLSLLVPDSRVVVTGAMRHPGLPGADGPGNLLSSVKVAASTEAASLGPVVVMSDEIHAARYVTKSHTSSVGAFTSSGASLVGRVTEDRVRIFAQPRVRTAHAFDPTQLAAAPAPPRVPVVTLALGTDADTIRAAVTGADGVVIEAYGGGHVPSGCVQAIADLCASVPVVITSRTGGGELYEATYGFPGSESDLRDRGLLFAGDLTGLKARLLLMAMLSAGLSGAQIRDVFARQ